MKLISYYMEKIKDTPHTQAVLYEKLKVYHTAFGIPIWKSTYYRRGGSGNWITTSGNIPFSASTHERLDTILILDSLKQKLSIEQIAYRKLTNTNIKESEVSTNNGAFTSSVPLRATTPGAAFSQVSFRQNVQRLLP